MTDSVNRLSIAEVIGILQQQLDTLVFIGIPRKIGGEGEDAKIIAISGSRERAVFEMEMLKQRICLEAEYEGEMEEVDEESAVTGAKNSEVVENEHLAPKYEFQSLSPNEWDECVRQVSAESEVRQVESSDNE